MIGNRPANHKASRVTIILAALGAVVITAVLVYLAAVAPRGVPTLKYVDVTARFNSTADLKLLSTVALNGKRVGQVNKIDSDGKVALVHLQLQPNTKLRSDTTARIRVKNPVGAKYVDLQPGRMGQFLTDGDTIPLSQTSTSVDTPELLQGFTPDARGNLSTTVQGLGKGFAGRGQEINQILPKSGPEVDNFGSASQAILARPGAAARFAPSAEQLARAYDPVRGDLAAGFRPQAAALEAFADSRANIQDLFGVAPSSLQNLRDAFNATSPLLEATAGFARATIRLTGPAPSALRQATALLQAGEPALQKTRPLLDALGDAVDPTLGALDTFRPEIRPTIRLLRTQLPILRQFNTQACDVKYQAQHWRSALGFGVPINTDPTSNLDAGDVGPRNNSFRVLAVNPDTPEALLSDSATPEQIANTVANDTFPAPCVAPTEFFGK
ncbi:MAG: phospholipid/cholesterol/gamma-HCH transport system substrate-binding protein [Solirubrobacteraceae bacterium]|nr:phospholipid/cholesterol/gamma-HCH transport system substrate-binding protein [Solirubrobacteraceae bacterium]